MPLLKLNGQKSIGQSSGHFELLMISKISLIEVQNFIYPWMRFWAGPTSFFWSKGSRGLLEVSFKGVMETSSRREFRIFRLRKGFNWNANWKNLLELFNWRLYKKSGDHGPVQPGPSKSQSELPVFLNSGTWILGSFVTVPGIVCGCEYLDWGTLIIKSDFRVMKIHIPPRLVLDIQNPSEFHLCYIGYVLCSNFLCSTCKLYVH